MAILLSFLCVAGTAEFNARLDTFPIGFWNYASIEVFDEAKIQEWQDAGITLTMGPEYSVTPENVARMQQILDWSDKRGIKVIVCDPRAQSRTPLPGDFVQQAADAAKDFAGHHATFGFHILDEPSKDDFQSCCDAVRAVKQAAPDRSPFVNLLPWHMGATGRVGYDDWGTYLDDFVQKSGIEFLCYDCYSQMNPGKTGWGMYFRNLREYGAAARRANIPFWTTILSVGHFNYRCPSEDDIRWQFNSSVAYGAQGILYFFFYMRNPHDNYRLSPVDEFWDRTPVFESLKRTNKGFTKRYGRLFLDLQLVKAMQFPEPIEGCEPFAADDLFVKAESTCPLIVSRFVDLQARPWVAVVNNTVDTNTNATLTFRGANTTAYEMNWENKETAAGVRKEEGGVSVSHWLAPGQMQVYRVDVKE
ncbi:MAG: hypothetical protein K1Y02_17225 [Candidatus Hydrogenedentes bacterium]|nr:hypothetical protein [Candidatus Hydrogenedentota bacterium]